MPIIPYASDTPTVGKGSFIAPDAWITGKVTIATDVTILFHAVLRGDVNGIFVGHGTNIQDHAMLHTSTGLGDCIVGDFVTIGHSAIIHGCKVESNCIIGMGATILDGAIIGENCIVGANSLVTMNTEIPPGSMVMGSPAKVVRALNQIEIEGIKASAVGYIETGRVYREFFLNNS